VALALPAGLLNARLLNGLVVVFLLAPVTAYGQASPVRIGPVTLSGSMQVDATTVSHDLRDQNANDIHLRRARIGLAGNLRSRVAWNVSAELTTAEMLRNAFIQVRVNRYATVRAGQATPISSIERAASPTAIEFVDRTRLTTRLTSPLDIGVTLFSERPLVGWVNYAVGVISGAGANRRDDNAAKDVVGRIEVLPPRLPHTSFVVAGGTGEQPAGQRTRASAGLQVDVSRLKIVAEALREHDEWAAVRDGVLVSGVYRIRPRHLTPHFRMIELAARFFTLDDPPLAHGVPGNIDDEGGSGAVPDFVPVTTREIQGGANYYANRNVRVLVNLLVPVDQRRTPGTIVVSRFQVAF
jgi:hypothetical protein